MTKPRGRFLLACRSAREAAKLREAFGDAVDILAPGEGLLHHNVTGIVALPLPSSSEESAKERWEEWLEYLRGGLKPGAQLVVL